MSASHKKLFSLIALVIIGVCTADAQQWVEVRSPNFSVMTDGGERNGRDVALRFEQLRTVFGYLFKQARLNTTAPLQIVAFRNHKEMRQISPLFQGKPIELSGYFQPGEDRNYIALDLSSASEDWTTVYHEYAHMLLNANYSGTTQPWFDEGFAEYYSTVKVSGKNVELGGVSQSRAEQLINSSPMPITELFSVKHDSRTYNEGDRRSLFYAQSWLMVHYLFDTNKMGDASNYFQLIDKGVPLEQAVQQAFKMSAKQFGNELDKYRRTPSAYLYHFKLPEALDHIQFTTVPMDAADGQAIVAELHAHEPDYQQQAIKEYEAVLKVKPDHAVANRGLGYAYLRANNFDKAAECFQRAAAQDSKDPRVHYFLAMLISRRGIASGRFAEDMATMRKELQTAIALDPQFADAYSHLAFVENFNRDFDKAIEHQKRALELSPRNDLYASNLAAYFMGAEKWDDAEALLRRLQNSAETGVAQSARMNLEQIGKMRQAAQEMREWKARQAAQATNAEATDSSPVVETVATTKPSASPAPIKYLKGVLNSLECAKAPSVELTITTGGKQLILEVPNEKELVLIGTDKFSCSWKNRKVMVNYRVIAKDVWKVVSLELQ